MTRKWLKSPESSVGGSPTGNINALHRFPCGECGRQCCFTTYFSCLKALAHLVPCSFHESLDTAAFKTSDSGTDPIPPRLTRMPSPNAYDVCCVSIVYIHCASRLRTKDPQRCITLGTTVEFRKCRFFHSLLSCPSRRGLLILHVHVLALRWIKNFSAVLILENVDSLWQMRSICKIVLGGEWNFTRRSLFIYLLVRTGKCIACWYSLYTLRLYPSRRSSYSLHAISAWFFHVVVNDEWRWFYLAVARFPNE
jgi:hypothetical protein